MKQMGYKGGWLGGEQTVMGTRAQPRASCAQARVSRPETRRLRSLRQGCLEKAGHEGKLLGAQETHTVEQGPGG